MTEKAFGTEAPEAAAGEPFVSFALSPDAPEALGDLAPEKAVPPKFKATGFHAVTVGLGTSSAGGEGLDF